MIRNKAKKKQMFTPAPRLVVRVAPLLLMALSMFMSPAVGYGSDFTLLFSNDVRGEIDPCG